MGHYVLPYPHFTLPGQTTWQTELRSRGGRRTTVVDSVYFVLRWTHGRFFYSSEHLKFPAGWAAGAFYPVNAETDWCARALTRLCGERRRLRTL